jgi:DNA polymerase III epsilon subunit-like protein
MNVLSLDCEYNQPSGKTIQIGAAIFDVKSGILLDKFETYVNPYEIITPEIVELTGITDQNVQDAPSIQEAYSELTKFSKKHKIVHNPLVWGSGARNDSQTIASEAGVLPENNIFGYRVLDVKTIYQSTQIFINKEFAGSLEKVCRRLSIPFEGQKHTALADAVMTFKVWQHLMKKYHDKF